MRGFWESECPEGVYANSFHIIEPFHLRAVWVFCLEKIPYMTTDKEIEINIRVECIFKYLLILTGQQTLRVTVQSWLVVHISNVSQVKYVDSVTRLTSQHKWLVMSWWIITDTISTLWIVKWTQTNSLNSVCGPIYRVSPYW